MKIVLDPGHGGKDPGAVGNGLREKDLTLDLAMRMGIILETEYEGVEVHLTRDRDVFLSLSERANLANRLQADYFLSLHVNAGGGTGFESYVYSAASQASVAYQNVIHPEVVAAIPGVADRGKKAANFAVLRETRMPALLTENLFIDNAKDATRLKDPTTLEDIAKGHTVGLAKAFGLERKPQPQTGPYPDVPADHWAAEVIQLALEEGIMSGYADGTFHPEKPLTRAEGAALAAQLLRKIMVK